MVYMHVHEYIMREMYVCIIVSWTSCGVHQVVPVCVRIGMRLSTESAYERSLRLRDTVAYRACERELPVEQSQYSEIQRQYTGTSCSEMFIYARACANHHSHLQRARAQSSGKTKTVLIAAVLVINRGTV